MERSCPEMIAGLRRTLTSATLAFGCLLSTHTVVRGEEGQPPLTEAAVYAIDTLSIPDEAYLEVGALAWLPGDRLAVGTRRGEIWIVEHPAAPQPTWSRFAHVCMRCWDWPGNLTRMPVRVVAGCMPRTDQK